jgi:hypothetical protein
MIIPQYPDLEFELVGFTDFRGDSAAAFRMSLARSRAVERHLVREGGVSTDRVNARGEGPAGTGAEARYVEIRVVNRDKLQGELEKRRPPMTGTAPSDTSGAARRDTTRTAPPDTTRTAPPDTSGSAPPDTSGVDGR